MDNRSERPRGNAEPYVPPYAIAAGLAAAASAGVMRPAGPQSIAPLAAGLGIILWRLAAMRRNIQAMQHLMEEEAQAETHERGIVGWRAWKVATDPTGRTLLRSLCMPYLWPPGDPARGEPESKPFLGGIHAFRKESNLKAYLTLNPYARGRTVLGTVALWGRTVESDHGWRSEFGYPLRIDRGDPALAAALARTYGCETAPRERTAFGRAHPEGESAERRRSA